MKQYAQMQDEELIAKLRAGDSGIMDFLLEKYKNLVRKKANALFLFGGDTDDLIQEGMIGLFKAIRDYRPEDSSFFSFAELCINRQIYTAIEAAARKKHGPLNSYISLSGRNLEEQDSDYSEELLAYNRNPEKILIDREEWLNLKEQIFESLSKMERQVLALYLEGMNYRQIATELDKTEKSIDNALQRIRQKSQKLYQQN